MSVYVGIDWSVKKHDVAIINEAGSLIAQFTIGHQASGFEKLNKTVPCKNLISIDPRKITSA